MEDRYKRKEQLIKELVKLRRRVSELESLETESKRAEEKLLTYQEHLRSFVAELLLNEEQERRRIAINLHEHIGQVLSISKIKLCALRESVSSADLAEALNEIRYLIEQTIQDIRSLALELSSPPSTNWVLGRRWNGSLNKSRKSTAFLSTLKRTHSQNHCRRMLRFFSFGQHES